MKTSVPALTLVAVIAFLVGILIILVAFLSKDQPVDMYSFESPENVPVGFIEGSLGYPSEVIPPELMVCAEGISSGEKYCTADHIEDPKYIYGEGYKIEVPAGEYHIYAMMPDQEDIKGYYSDYVTCGLRPGCVFHTPIRVMVLGGETVENIDPRDWYEGQ